MQYPFKLTQDIISAYQEHQDYIGQGQRWLVKNDPEGQEEQRLIEAIQSAVRSAAQQHYGSDEDSEYEFYDAVQLDESQGIWYEMVEAVV